MQKKANKMVLAEHVSASLLACARNAEVVTPLYYTQHDDGTFSTIHILVVRIFELAKIQLAAPRIINKTYISFIVSKF
jgi:hypothetical protein